MIATVGLPRAARAVRALMRPAHVVAAYRVRARAQALDSVLGCNTRLLLLFFGGVGFAVARRPPKGTNCDATS